MVQAASTTYPAATLNTLAPGAPVTLTKSGYLYIWVSNETQGWDVFFDNLSVQHLQGPMLEENHYYPFGLTMQGISDKALKTRYAENKYRYNDGTELQNKEFSDGTGLELYETSFRSFDPQLGRFGQIDPLTDRANYQSAYQYAGNNPVSANDPTGLKVSPPKQWDDIRSAWSIGGHLDDSWWGLSGGQTFGGGGGGGSASSNGGPVIEFKVLWNTDDAAGDQNSNDEAGCSISDNYGDPENSTEYQYHADFAGDNTDLDQSSHAEANNVVQQIADMLGENYDVPQI